MLRQTSKEQNIDPDTLNRLQDEWYAVKEKIETEIDKKNILDRVALLGSIKKDEQKMLLCSFCCSMLGIFVVPKPHLASGDGIPAATHFLLTNGSTFVWVSLLLMQFDFYQQPLATLTDSARSINLFISHMQRIGELKKIDKKDSIYDFFEQVDASIEKLQNRQNELAKQQQLEQERLEAEKARLGALETDLKKLGFFGEKRLATAVCDANQIQQQLQSPVVGVHEGIIVANENHKK